MVVFDGSKYTIPASGHYKEKEITLPTIHVLDKDKETGDWLPTGKYLYMDGYLFNNLYRAKQNAKRYNGDILYVVDGQEGSGKSTINRQISIVLDNDFTERQICYSTKEAMRLHFSLGKWRAVNLDESKEDLDRKSTMSRKNKEFNNLLSQSRQLHKFLGVTLPSIYDLDKYVAEHRAVFLIHCYKHRGSKPGYFRFYGKKGIQKLFATGYKYRNYPVKAAFYGHFLKQEVVNLDEYNKRKREAIDKYRESAEQEPKTKDDIIREFIMWRIEEWDNDPELSEIKVTKEQQANIFGYTRATVLNWLKQEDEEDD